MTTPTRPAAISCALKTLAFGIAVLAILAAVGFFFDKVLPWFDEMNTVFWRYWWSWYDNYPTAMYWASWSINFICMLNLAFAVCLLNHNDPEDGKKKTGFYVLISGLVYLEAFYLWTRYPTAEDFNIYEYVAMWFAYIPCGILVLGVIYFFISVVCESQYE